MTEAIFSPAIKNVFLQNFCCMKFCLLPMPIDIPPTTVVNAKLV